MKPKLIASLIIGIFLCSLLNAQETQNQEAMIFLMDGNQINGEIIKDDSSTIEVVTGFGTLIIEKKNIKRIEEIRPQNAILHLEDGSLISGVLLFENENDIEIESELGTLKISKDKISRIEKNTIKSDDISLFYGEEYEIYYTKESWSGIPTLSFYSGHERKERGERSIHYDEKGTLKHINCSVEMEYMFGLTTKFMTQRNYVIDISKLNFELKIELEEEQLIFEEYYEIEDKIELLKTDVSSLPFNLESYHQTLLGPTQSLKQILDNEYYEQEEYEHEIEYEPIGEFKGYQIIPVLKISKHLRYMSRTASGADRRFFIASVFIKII